ncbi:MAG: type II secretion system protein N [Sphingorhabdus sp.]
MGLAFRRRSSFPTAILLIILLATGLAAQSARLFWALVTDVGPVGNWRAATVNVVPQAARAGLFSGFDPFYRDDLISPAVDSVTSLNLTLYGIRANESSGGGSAIIAGEDGQQVSYAVGEEVVPGVVLDAVAFDHVILSRGGVKESLYIDQSVPAETVNPAPVGAGETDSLASSAQDVGINAQSLQKAISIAPRNEGGRVTGLVLSPRDDGTMLRVAGFQAGDIVVAINGRPVSSASDISSQLRPGARLSIEIERGGSKVPIALNLEQP